MSIFISYIREFLKTVHGGLLIFSLLYTALIIFLNYRFGIEPKILYNISNKLYRFSGFYLVYLIAFAVPYLVIFLIKGKQIVEWKFLLFLILFAPAVFAVKVSFTGVTQFIQSNMTGVGGKYYAIVANLPSKLMVVIMLLTFVWWLGDYQRPFFGVTTKDFNTTPYLLMLLIMMPLITWASFQHDFLLTYPKLKQVAFINAYSKYPWWHALLFEIAYGIDFITIELFFRGFLVLAFVRHAGQDAIIPMAVFYCSIHFGKPLAECISSFFGGLLLGIIVYKTGSITGGLMVHLGIAWMMEAGGYLGNLLKK